MRLSEAHRLERVLPAGIGDKPDNEARFKEIAVRNTVG
jgi:hypothetical protein